MSQPSLLAWAEGALYPDSAGFKRHGTSSEAAEAVRPRAKSIRDRVLDLLRQCAMSPDEAADRLGLSILAVRPRFSELLALHLIEETGVKHWNASGKRANTYRIKLGDKV